MNGGPMAIDLLFIRQGHNGGKLYCNTGAVCEDKAKTLGKRFLRDVFNAGGVNRRDNLKAERIRHSAQSDDDIGNAS